MIYVIEHLSENVNILMWTT